MKTLSLNKLSLLTGIVFVLLLSATLYFYKLDTIPNGLYVDEAVSGYNSYSLYLTGRDEYGKSLPIALRYFASFTPPLYAYTSIIPIHFLGLTEFSTRVTAAISGVISVLIAYFFLKELKIFTSKYKLLLGTLLFAISPWVVFYSRVGYEIYFAFLLFIIGAYFCLKALTSPKYLFISTFFLSLSAFTSHTHKYLLVLWIPFYFVVFRKELNFKKNSKTILINLFLGLIILSPYLSLLNTGALQSKNSLFYSEAIISRATTLSIPPVFSIPISTSYEFLARYVTYFSPKSLFFVGDPDPQRSIPELSIFYPWMLIPYITGLLLLTKKLKDKRYRYLLFMLLVTPIPAALTQDPFSTQRALPVFFPLFLIISLGISKIVEIKNKLVLLFIVITILLYSIFMLWRSYFVLFSVEKAQAWGFGYKQLIEEINKRPKTSFVIDQTRLKPVYIQYAFYKKFDPQKMQALYRFDFVNNYYNEINFDSPMKLDETEFRSIVWKDDICKSQILVGDYLSFSENNVTEHFLTWEFTISDPRGEILFVGYKTHPELKCNK